MSFSTTPGEPRAVSVAVTDDAVVVALDDGRTLSTPLSWYPRLVRATREQRARFELVGRGLGVHWPEIDEDLSIAGMLSGARARTRAR